ncbi:MAG: hypothetical protein K2J20_01265, partial [Bacilli bacterium]|nr:hypothetical protein [Bacilli bacterium]
NIRDLFNKSDIDTSREATRAVLEVYGKSLDLEKDLVRDITDEIFWSNISNVPEFPMDIGGFTGDVSKSDKGDNKIVGLITDRVDWIWLPNYFAMGYATSAEYNKGQVVYDIQQPMVDFTKFQDVNGLFTINFDISRRDLAKAIDKQRLFLEQTLYPVGYDYVITQVEISDLDDESKSLVIDAKRASITRNAISGEEEKLLRSMKRPSIFYTYGFSYSVEKGNSFLEEMHKEGQYTEFANSEVMEAIIQGLGLDSNATAEEIYDRIKSKTYSKTPIKDEGLTWAIKWQNEKEYFETIASLDSLVCNLAASLAVQVDDDLVYVVGYATNDSMYILKGDAHAWAMNSEGQIVDVTPSIEKPKEDNKLKTMIDDVMSWVAQNRIPIYIGLALMALLVQKIYGKKIVFKLKVLKLEYLLDKPEVAEALAKIMELCYGGINIPCERTPRESVDVIAKDLANFSKEELEELQRELQKLKASNKVVLNTASEIIKEVPFIRKNTDELQRVLKKKEEAQKRGNKDECH